MNNIEQLITETSPISDKLLQGTKKAAAKAAEEVKVVLQTDLVEGKKPPKPDLFHQYLSDSAVMNNTEKSVASLNEKAAVKAYSDIPPMPLN